jgi:hypothetical protein
MLISHFLGHSSMVLADGQTGFQGVVWVYPSEILPLRLRQKGSALSTAVNWLTNYAIGKFSSHSYGNNLQC